MIYQPTLKHITSALFIQPHPDDNEIGVGGTMALLVQQNIPVYALTVTNGDGGSNAHDPQTLSRLRAQEAQNAADILGVTYLGSLGYNNQNPGTVESICEDIVAVMRKYQIQTIFSVDPTLENECHPVHLAVGLAVNQAFVRCGQAYYPFHDNMVHDNAYYPEILGHYFTTKETEVIGIDTVFNTKMQAVQAHVSQMNPEFIEAIIMLSKAHAFNTPYEYAERIKLLSRMQTHCFAIHPDVAKAMMK